MLEAERVGLDFEKRSAEYLFEWAVASGWSHSAIMDLWVKPIEK